MNSFIESNQSIITSSDMQPLRMRPFQQNTPMLTSTFPEPPPFPEKIQSSVPRIIASGYPCFSLRKMDLSARRQWSYKARVHTVPVEAKYKRSKMTQCDRRTRRVRFAPNLTKTIEPTTEPTREEIASSWYRPKDYQRFVKEIQTILTKWRSVGGNMRLFDAEKYCTLGLEQQLPKGNALMRRLRNQRYTRYVLEQQSVQRYCGIHEPEVLREVSQIFSAQDGQRAQLEAVLSYSLNCADDESERKHKKHA